MSTALAIQEVFHEETALRRRPYLVKRQPLQRTGVLCCRLIDLLPPEVLADLQRMTMQA